MEHRRGKEFFLCSDCFPIVLPLCSSWMWNEGNSAILSYLPLHSQCVHIVFLLEEKEKSGAADGGERKEEGRRRDGGGERGKER